MSTIQEILTQVQSGAVQPADAAKQISQIIQQNLVGGSGDSYKEQKFTSMADRDDSNFENSFSQVTAAWIGGDLTDGQYHTIQEGVLAATGAQGVSQEEGEAAEEKPAAPTAVENLKAQFGGGSGD